MKNILGRKCQRFCRHTPHGPTPTTTCTFNLPIAYLLLLLFFCCYFDSADFILHLSAQFLEYIWQLPDANSHSREIKDPKSGEHCTEWMTGYLTVVGWDVELAFVSKSWGRRRRRRKPDRPRKPLNKFPFIKLIDGLFAALAIEQGLLWRRAWVQMISDPVQIFPIHRIIGELFCCWLHWMRYSLHILYIWGFIAIRKSSFRGYFVKDWSIAYY